MKKLEYDYVKEQFEKEGYKLLSKEYIDVLSKLKVECPEEHQYEVRYNCFQRGQRCPVCANVAKPSYDQRKKLFKKYGWKLKTEEYKNNHTPLSVECPLGHLYKVAYHNFQQGNRCPICANKIRSNKRRLIHSFIKEQFEKEGYKLLSNEYIDNSIKLKVECPKGHQYEVAYNSFKQGNRCPICHDIVKHSRSEKDCLDVVKQQKNCLDVVKQLTNENVIENDRTQIVNPNTNKYLELDIYIPSLNKAVEFNGEYWHNNDYSKYKDNQKVKQCKEKGIDLLIIWYQNWIDNRESQIDNLKSFLK